MQNNKCIWKVCISFEEYSFMLLLDYGDLLVLVNSIEV
jgi:hypothetical protein